MANQTVPTYDAPLLLRLAEAADGYRDGQNHYFVFNRHEPSDEDREFPTLADANEYLSQKTTPADFVVFGPCQTPIDNAALGVTNVSVTWNDSTPKLDTDVAAKADCIFWSASAVDKFLIPYYARVWGVEAAERLRNTLLNCQWVAHPPGSYSRGRSLIVAAQGSETFVINLPDCSTEDWAG